MLKIILILVLTKNLRVFGNEDNFGKFIDLLPEEEKEEFLDRIARRILAGINNEKNANSNPNKPDVEINDEQLDVHDEFVKDILREEAKRYEDDKRHDGSQNNEEGGGDNGDENKYIDLTLRDGKVLKINGEEEQMTTSEIPYNVIPVKTVYDDDVNDEYPQTSSTKLEDESDHFSNMSPNSVNKEDNLRKSFQNSLNNVRTSTYFDTSLVTEDNSINKENTSPTTEESKNERNSNEVTIENRHNTKESEDLNKQKNSDLAFEDNTTTDVATTISAIQSNLYNDGDKYDSTTQIIKDTEISSQNNLKDITEHLQRSDDIQNVSTVVVSTTDINEANMANLVKVTKIQKDTTNNSLTNQTNKSEEKSKVDLLLRSGNKKSRDEISVKKLDTEPRRGKEYEVFEVAADKPPFKLLNKDETNNPPRYVPIYDYASENAYFQPYDKFGPRGVEHEKLKRYDIIEEKDENEFNAKAFSRNRFSAYNNDEGGQYRMKYNYPIQTENTDMYGFMKPVQAHFISNLNPYDYFDMDYINNGRYILRNLEESDKPFLDSDDSDRLFNSIHKSDSAKDHVRAVRELLYLQKRFGYVPEFDEELRKSGPKAKKSIPKKKDIEKFMDYEDKISLDYYYDRDDHERKGSRNIELSKVPSKVKIIVPIRSKEVVEDFDEVSNSVDEKYSSSIDIIENINNLVQTEVDEKEYSSFFDAMLEVLNDMIRLNDEGLENYEWLRSSVDIQSAIRRLLDLTESLKYGEEMHPKDLELLKYCLYLYKSSKTSLQKYDRVNVDKRERKAFLPKNRKKKKTKHPLVLWKDFAKYIRNINKSENEQNLGLLLEFEDFLKRILISLNDLHDAIKHIAMVTKFDTQNWFSDLKEVYLKKANKKELGAVLLHFSVLTLVENLEDEADIISKMNFRLFVEHNREKVKATRKEFTFVLRVLDELNRINI